MLWDFRTAGGKPSWSFGRYRLNQPPTANAGSGQTVIVNETAQINGSGSSDPDNNPLTYAWEITSKPAGSSAALSNPAIVNPTFVADVAGEYRVSLTVNDGTVNSTPDEAIITARTAQAATQSLVEQVRALNKPQGNGLIGMLNVVINRLDNNRIDNAIEMLRQFIGQMNVFIRNGTFTVAEGQPLIDAANRIIAALQSGGLPKLAVNAQPTEYGLSQNYPNSFNPVTVINYQLPIHSYVSLKVFDVVGREVATLVDEVQDAGFRSVKFDASSLSSGVYLYRMTAGTYVETKKLLLTK